MTVLRASEPIEAIAIKAQNIDAQAVTIKAALNKITTTIAGVWDLETNKKDVVDTSKAVFIPHKNPGSESVVEGDDRTLVDPVHFAPGGKYRSILRLFIKYENLGDNKFAHGTGWLIRPDVMITAGHNINAYAGYNGASSIKDPSVEVRKAKRVVTTSQWLSNRGSMAHDFAMVMFDEPFTNATPFPYIETPAKDKLELGVVGYPADKIDERNGERGGRMYELFETTEYNLMEQKDTMLQHFIDSEGGNSGGPVLRGSDLCAIATHVYGGDANTASVLGRYGNPVQDYIAAFDLPLANPGQINLVPVNSDAISQANAATGHQVSEIAKLGDNVVAPASEKSSKAEFWIFEGADEIFRLTKDIAETFGPVIADPVGAVILPTIVQGIKLAQPEGHFDLDASLRRALLTNSIFLVAQQRGANEEGLFDDLANLVAAPLKLGPLTPVGSPVIKLPFEDIMAAIGVIGSAAEKLVDDVAGELTRGLLTRAQIPILGRIGTIKPESATDKKAGSTTDATRTVGDVLSDGAKLVGKTAIDSVNFAVDTVNDSVNVVTSVPVVGDLFGCAIRAEPAYWMLQALGKAAKDVRIESAFDDEINNKSTNGSMPEGLFDDLAQEISKLAQALILHQVLADRFLTAQMGRPVAELKEEGFFDDVGDFFSDAKNIMAIGGGIEVAAGATAFIPAVGPMVGLGLLGLGAGVAFVGVAMET
ncbi:hypothetical protein F5B19DRAFT_484385 [Rostrohypoxylon terebratum]|nr:hypothetical protein F5B19DRAFT_484385 [Rostrohypoxylon terebratum]